MQQEDYVTEDSLLKLTMGEYIWKRNHQAYMIFTTFIHMSSMIIQLNLFLHKTELGGFIPPNSAI